MRPVRLPFIRSRHEGASSCVELTTRRIWQRRDGELDVVESQALERHLSACSTCRREANLLAGITQAVRADPAPAVPLPSGPQAVAWLREEERRSATRSRGWLLAAPAMAASALAIWAVTANRETRLAPQLPLASAYQAPPSRTDLAAQPLLVVVDDERTGRQVMIAPPPQP